MLYFYFVENMDFIVILKWNGLGHYSKNLITFCSWKYEFCIPQKVWWSIRKSNATIAVLVLSQLFYYSVFEKMSSVLNRNCFKKMILKHLNYCKNVIPILLLKHKGVYDAEMNDCSMLYHVSWHNISLVLYIYVATKSWQCGTPGMLIRVSTDCWKDDKYMTMTFIFIYSFPCINMWFYSVAVKFSLNTGVG